MDKLKLYYLSYGTTSKLEIKIKIFEQIEVLLFVISS